MSKPTKWDSEQIFDDFIKGKGNSKNIIKNLYRVVIFYENNVKTGKALMNGKRIESFNKKFMAIEDWKYFQKIKETDQEILKILNGESNYSIELERKNFVLFYFYDNDKNQLSSVLRHIRNSMCHAKYEKIVIKKKHYLIIKDYNPKKEGYTMLLKLLVSDLEKFVHEAIQYLSSSSKEKQP